ncbi:glycosyltransferase [Enterococcus sp. AZ109]|uniref:glycosyltransferase n=1 Tax=Enterococcus sp. AZ109 TaxID=2774634 RepID=UPI003F247EE8
MKVLQVVGGLKQGGAEAMIMSVFRTIDPKNCTFDFLLYEEQDTSYVKEALKQGAKIHVLTNRKNLWQYYRQFKKIIAENGYDAIHVHLNHHSAVPLFFAKKLGVPIRICHSHSAIQEKKTSFIRSVYVHTTRFIIAKTATKLVGCSQLAGNSLYGEKAFRTRGVIYHNAINTEDFTTVDRGTITQCKNKLKLSKHSLVIGHIGSFRPAKNHAFLIKLAAALKHQKVDFKLVLVGDGPLHAAIKAEVAKRKLEEEVLFLGLRSDVPLLMQVFDVLLMPSLYEGYPVTLVEAQAAQLPIVAATTITNEVEAKELGLITWLDLEASLDHWIGTILSVNRSSSPILDVQVQLRKEIIRQRFDIDGKTELFYSLYT